jgi:hypothetical protein
MWVSEQTGRSPLDQVNQVRDVRAQAAHTREFRNTLLPLQGGLYDERMYEKVD